MLQNDVRLSGPVLADLGVSTSGADADGVVQLIDAFRLDAKNFPRRSGEAASGLERHKCPVCQCRAGT